MQKKSIWEIAKENPDRWLNGSFFTEEDQLWDLAEGGGLVKYCTICELTAQPNRPCFCGAWVIQRLDGKFWAETGDSLWTYDWRYKAEHFWSIDNARIVAKALDADFGVLALRRVGEGCWSHARYEEAEDPVSIKLLNQKIGYGE